MSEKAKIKQLFEQWQNFRFDQLHDNQVFFMEVVLGIKLFRVTGDHSFYFVWLSVPNIKDTEDWVNEVRMIKAGSEAQAIRLAIAMFDTLRAKVENLTEAETAIANQGAAPTAPLPPEEE